MTFTMTRLSRLITCVVVISFLCSYSFAWSKSGHMLTGAIAHQDLKQRDPAAAKVVAELLWNSTLPKIHKEADSYYSHDMDPQFRFFLAAARWADDVRDLKEEHQKYWHFINIPYKPDGEPNWIRPSNPKRSNIKVTLTEQIKILRDEDSTDADKAKALVWVFHLVGDIHQPLHTIAIFSKQYPRGDSGGNAIYIRPQIGKGAINLHSYWDRSLGTSDNVTDIKNQGILLRNMHTRSSLDEVEEDDLDAWIKESYDLAVEAAYLSGELTMAKKASQAVPVPDGYNDTMKTASEKRAVLAGYRLSDLLSSIF